MRVIAGRWRGRMLKAPPGTDLRPTTDRVKEALFNILRAEVPGSTFLDLCCGAGGLGIEALSRGAVRSVFVDLSGSALAATAANLESCGAERASFSLVREDALSFLRRFLDRPVRGGWVMVADPPYAADLAGAILGLAGGLVVAAGLRAAAVEHGTRLDAAGLTGGRGQVRRYGRTSLTILRPADEGDDAHE